MEFSSESIFILEYILKYSLNSGLVRTFNETILNIRDFIENLIRIGRYKVSNHGKDGKVEVFAKITGGSGGSRYMKKSEYFPHQLLRDKSMQQYISFVYTTRTGEIYKEIVSVPFMIGSKWCATSNMNPIQLHSNGENAIDYRGAFIIDGTMRYFIAHEKIEETDGEDQLG
jgi:hypothetical protein